MDIEQKLTELKQAREEVAFWKSQKNSVINSAKESVEYKLADDEENRNSISVQSLEEEIRALGIAEYQSNGNKKPHPKVVVKIFKWFKIADPEKVRQWAFGNLPAALKLDEKKIEKYATEFGGVDGTESGEEPRVQIATEL